MLKHRNEHPPQQAAWMELDGLIAANNQGTAVVTKSAALPHRATRFTYRLWRVDPMTGLFAGLVTQVRVETDAEAIDELNAWLAKRWLTALKQASAQQVAA